MEHAAPRPSWWSRNWKWFLPVGCLLPMLICGGIIAAIVFGVMGALKSAEPYVKSIEMVQNDPAAQAALGSPINAGFTISGEISVSNGDGDCDISYPVTGPNGTGTVAVEATRVAGVWSYDLVTLTIDATGEQIDLLAPE